MKQSKLRVLLLTDGIYPYVIGGMQKHSYYLSKILPKLNIELTLVHTSSNTNQIISNQELNNKLGHPENTIKSYFIPMSISGKYPGHYLLESYQYSSKVYEEIKGSINSFDLIYIKGLSGWKTLLKKKDISTPIIYNAHGYEMFQYANGIKMKLKQWMLRPVFKYQLNKANYIVSYGGKITTLLQDLKIKASKIIEIPAGFEKSKIKTKPPKPFQGKLRFLFVGRNERRKGINEINRAISTINKSAISNKYAFTFVGPIPEKTKIKSPNVSYLGELKSYEELEVVYKKSDVLLAPSLSEGMPNVIMEAMANGLAIITTDVGANSLLVNEENGVLLPVPVKNTLLDEIKNLSTLPSNELEIKKKASLKKINGFTWDKIGLETKNLFQKLINSER